jgi:hypothetical protein
MVSDAHCNSETFLQCIFESLLIQNLQNLASALFFILSGNICDLATSIPLPKSAYRHRACTHLPQPIPPSPPPAPCLLSTYHTTTPPPPPSSSSYRLLFYLRINITMEYITVLELNLVIISPHRLSHPHVNPSLPLPPPLTWGGGDKPLVT